jgi:hypothetical protein
MSLRMENTHRSNHSIFLPQNYGSPFNDMAEHIAGLGLSRIDFERCAVAGEVIYSVEGDSTRTSQQDEEARIATLAHALKKLGNPEDAAEFMRCPNAICEEGDARYRQVAASYYYGEIAERGAGPVLKEMALIAMHLPSLNPVMEEVESESETVYALRSQLPATKREARCSGGLSLYYPIAVYWSSETSRQLTLAPEINSIER